MKKIFQGKPKLLPRDLESEAVLKQLDAILHDEVEYQNLVSQEGELAQALLDALQLITTSPRTTSQLRSTILKAVLRLSRQSNLYPQCLTIRNVKRLGEHAVASGGFGEIWKGGIEGSPEVMCLKVVKLYQTSNIEKLLKDFIREAIVWRQLEHPNLLPFLGLFFLAESKQQLCLISPWVENGNLIQFLEGTPRTDVKHRHLVWDVANGLQHLHQMKIIHADLKGANVLITKAGRAIVADFGLSYVAEGEVLKMTSSSAFLGGTPRWLAPELLNHASRPSYESDIYAFGCVCYEIYTGLRPFHELRSDPAVILEVVNGKRPSRPAHVSELDDDIWTLMNECWATDTSFRPDADALKHRLFSIFGIVESPPPWDLTISKQIRLDVRGEDIPSKSQQVAIFLSQSYERLQIRRRQLIPATQDQLSAHRDAVLRLQGSQHPIPVSVLPQDRHRTVNAGALIPRNIDAPTAGWFRGWNISVVESLRGRPPWQIGRPKDGEIQRELTKMISNIIAFERENWELVLEICERAYSNELLAKEAIRALRLEFKYGEPAGQLRAGRLWATMLYRDLTGLFIIESTSRKFLDTLGDLITNSKTNPVVKEQVLDVLAAAVFAYANDKGAAFKGLWKKVKPPEKPDEGVPFKTNDIIFTSATYLFNDTVPGSSSKMCNGSIPPDKLEDTRRLFQECKIGMGNARLLADALLATTPEEVLNGSQGLIKEFRGKCLSSRELIAAQIPWATAGAERSRQEKDAAKQGGAGGDANEDSGEQTTEEQLLADLLEANEELNRVIDQYDDLERVAIERKAEEERKRVVRMDQKVIFLAIFLVTAGIALSFPRQYMI